MLTLGLPHFWRASSKHEYVHRAVDIFPLAVCLAVGLAEYNFKPFITLLGHARPDPFEY